jgi:hypothetical protein
VQHVLVGQPRAHLAVAGATAGGFAAVRPLGDQQPPSADFLLVLLAFGIGCVLLIEELRIAALNRRVRRWQYQAENELKNVAYWRERALVAESRRPWTIENLGVRQ